MLCLEARTIASRAGESGRQERNSSVLGLQAHLPPPGGQECSAFRVVYIWWFWSVASVLLSFGHWTPISFCAMLHPVCPWNPLAPWLPGDMCSEPTSQSNTSPAMVTATGSEGGMEPIRRQRKTMRPLLGLLGTGSCFFSPNLNLGWSGGTK